MSYIVNPVFIIQIHAKNTIIRIFTYFITVKSPINGISCYPGYIQPGRRFRKDQFFIHG